jgi:hypothetical protein
MAWEKKQIKFSTFEETIPLEIIGDGSVMVTEKFEGKMIPAIIFNKNQKPQLTELIRVHQFTQEGDIISTWQKPVLGKDRCELIISFKQPVSLNIRIFFNAIKYFNLIYLILKNQSLYIIPGEPGDRMIHVMNSPKILAEIPRLTSIEEWETYFFSVLIKSPRMKHLPKKQRKKIAIAHIEKMKEIAEIRHVN